MTFAAVLSLLALAAWLYLTFLNGRFWQILLAAPDLKAKDPSSWPSVDIIVPARNEADVLPRSLVSLLKQDYPGTWRVVLIDDHSSDDTGGTAERLAAQFGLRDRLLVLKAPDLTEGWSGKVAALEVGVKLSQSDYILFTDADIEHVHSSLRNLVAHALEHRLDLTSRMVKLHCNTFAEKLLIPAFVFFFAMLYPFARVNDPNSGVAGAAGGVMLLSRQTLDQIGGLARIKSALIDDCSLARAVKDHRGPQNTRSKIELTLTTDIKSLRVYGEISDVWRMIARTAFTQLRHSPWLLIGTVFGMGILFLVPVVLPFTGKPLAAEAGAAAWVCMSMIYLPIIRFYDLPLRWVLALPVAAVIYILATIDSGRLYWQGKGGQWKGRKQA